MCVILHLCVCVCMCVVLLCCHYFPNSFCCSVAIKAILEQSCPLWKHGTWSCVGKCDCQKSLMNVWHPHCYRFICVKRSSDVFFCLFFFFALFLPKKRRSFWIWTTLRADSQEADEVSLVIRLHHVRGCPVCDLCQLLTLSVKDLSRIISGKLIHIPPDTEMRSALCSL